MGWVRRGRRRAGGRPRDLAAERDAHLGCVDWFALPPGAHRDGVEVPSGRLARIWMGPAGGPRILMVPGVTGSKEDFILMMPMLAGAGYRAEAYDMAGQYESWQAGPEHTARPDEGYTLQLFVDDLLAMIGAGGVPVHLLGYSFAGTVAAQVSVDHPELVAGLTLLSSPPIAGQSLRRFRIIGPLSGALPGRLIGRLLVWALRHNLSLSGRDRARLVRTRLDLTRTSSVGDVMDLMKHVPDLSAGLRASGVPVLVCAGSGDVWPIKYHRAFARACGARFAGFRSGHAICETAPNQLVRAMLPLLDAARTRRQGPVSARFDEPPRDADGPSRTATDAGPSRPPAS